jgi:hypothetical protein
VQEVLRYFGDIAVIFRPCTNWAMAETKPGNVKKKGCSNACSSQHTSRDGRWRSTCPRHPSRGSRKELMVRPKEAAQHSGAFEGSCVWTGRWPPATGANN